MLGVNALLKPELDVDLLLHTPLTVLEYSVYAE